MTTATISEYDQQAIDFLVKTGVLFEAKFLENSIHFDGDKDKRDIYQITLKRGEREFVFRFGNSINASGRFWKYGDYRKGADMGQVRREDKNEDGTPKKNAIYFKPMGFGANADWERNKDFKEPSAYDILACLTKYDPIDLENFCSEFGYDSDSISANKTYKSVKDEYQNVCMLWNDSEIEELAEIQ